MLKPPTHVFVPKNAAGQLCCATCPAVVTESTFKDDLSIKEYYISGMCQSCQDEAFGYLEQIANQQYDTGEDEPAF